MGFAKAEDEYDQPDLCSLDCIFIAGHRLFASLPLIVEASRGKLATSNSISVAACVAAS